MQVIGFMHGPVPGRSRLAIARTSARWRSGGPRNASRRRALSCGLNSPRRSPMAHPRPRSATATDGSAAASRDEEAGRARMERKRWRRAWRRRFPGSDPVNVTQPRQAKIDKQASKKERRSERRLRGATAGRFGRLLHGCASAGNALVRFLDATRASICKQIRQASRCKPALGGMPRRAASSGSSHGSQVFRHRRHSRPRQRRDHARARAEGRAGRGPHVPARRASPPRGDRQGHAAVRLHDRDRAGRGLHLGRHGRAADSARCRRRRSPC